jgi:hypothetical protein
MAVKSFITLAPGDGVKVRAKAIVEVGVCGRFHKTVLFVTHEWPSKLECLSLTRIANLA